MNRLRESFMTDDIRARALLEPACGYVDQIHLVQGVAGYEFFLDDLPDGIHGEHYLGEAVVIGSKTVHQFLAAFHEFGHALDGSFLNSIQGYGTPQAPHGFAYGSNLADSDPSSLLGDWLSAVRSSAYFATLNDVLDVLQVSPAQAKESGNS